LSDLANALRGEARFVVRGTARVLRPSFASLVAAEEELGPLFALVERAASGQLKLGELVALFWHCLAERSDIVRDEIAEAVVASGLAGCAKPLRALLEQILQGRA
jgi:hypothetical protein